MSFVKDILKVLDKHKKITPDMGVLCNELIQLCCAISFEFIGEEKGRKDLINMIETCYRHSKNTCSDKQ